MRGPRGGPRGGLGLTLLLLPVVALLVGLPSHPVLSARQEGSCRFPSRWEGQWFQSGVRQGITILHNRLSNKGRCVASDGEKYLVVDEKGSCFRCVVIHEKHINVLQYKETFCQGHTSLDQLCKLITGDALLFSMFRLGGSPVACPFRGPLAFTYNRGHGDCRSPMSSVEACTQESRLLLRYQACPDVYGTESTAEELQCLATWKEGSARYLVGKVHHSHATSNEDRFRCFVYEQVNAHSANSLAGNGLALGLGLGLGMDEEAMGAMGAMGGMGRGHDAGVVFRVAQSGDATCNGLSSDMEGSRTMTLYKAEATAPPRCKFPGWLSAHPHWHTLDYRRSYSLHQKNTSLKISNSTAGSDMDDVERDGGGRGGSRGPGVDMLDPVVAAATGMDPQDNQHDEMRVTCTELKMENERTAHVVAHFTMGCQSGFLCLQFHRRDSHVIEVQTGAQTRRQEDACLPANFDRNTLPFVTLVTSSPEPKQCPYLGKFSVSGLLREERRARSAGAGAGAGYSQGSSRRGASPASSAPGRWYRRALQEYNPEDDDGGFGEEEEEDDEGTYGGTTRDVRRRPAGIDEQQEEARLFNKKKKQQEERDARIKADHAARQEWLQKQQQQQQQEGKKLPVAESGGGQRRSGLKSHSKRSSGHKAVIEVASAAGDDDDDEDEDEDEDEDDEDDIDDEDLDGAIPDPSDLHVDKLPALHRPAIIKSNVSPGGASANNAGVDAAQGLGHQGLGHQGRGHVQGGRYRPHTPEYGNIDDLLEASKSSTHWGTYPSDERLLELDSKSSSMANSKSGRGRRVRGLARHNHGHGDVHADGHGGQEHGQGRRVRRAFGGYEGAMALGLGVGGVDPCEREPGGAAAGPGPGGAASGALHLYMGCSTQDTMEFRRDCGAPEPDVVSAYTCHGRWEENGTHFLITSPLPRSSRGARRLCFAYREHQGVLHFASSGESCPRVAASSASGAFGSGRGPSGAGAGVSMGVAMSHASAPAPFTFNVTSSGECSDTSRGTPTASASRLVLSCVSALVILIATQR